MEPNKINIQDTICAISTPPGIGGIAVARISGPRAIDIVDTLWTGRSLNRCDSHSVHLGTISDCHNQPLDQAVVTIYRAPRSFTGEDVVEISVHGSRWIQRELIAVLCQAGCRLAEPGEFTRRALVAGKMDLAEAEAVADIIASSSRAAHRIASSQLRGHYSSYLASMREKLIELASLLELELDFSEEEVEFASRSKLIDLANQLYTDLKRLAGSFSSGAAIKNGIPVAIIGPTNAGKSSLLNAITGDERAIVSDIHGTTRDVVEDLVETGDYLIRFQDTAGLRTTTDTIEQMGIDRTRATASRANIIIYTIDITNPVAIETVADELPRETPVIIYLNKTDLVDSAHVSVVMDRYTQAFPACTVIAGTVTSIGDIDKIRATLIRLLDANYNIAATGDILVTNARHFQALNLAADSISRVIEGLRENLSGDLVAQDIRETIHHLSTITSAISTPEILATIFSRFCIGK